MGDQGASPALDEGAALLLPNTARLISEGHPVLFLHGLGASSRYRDRLTASAPGYRGIAPDLVGFGRSPKPPDGACDVEHHLAPIRPLMSPGAIVVGHSTGPILAAALAAAAPPVPLGGVVVPRSPGDSLCDGLQLRAQSWRWWWCRSGTWG
ncbi:MAG: alpha/beta fold hydrolase [Acidimicrobiales bacterium]